jgi:hypothetical protein
MRGWACRTRTCKRHFEKAIEMFGRILIALRNILGPLAGSSGWPAGTARIATISPDDPAADFPVTHFVCAERRHSSRAISSTSLMMRRRNLGSLIRVNALGSASPSLDARKSDT